MELIIYIGILSLLLGSFVGIVVRLSRAQGQVGSVVYSTRTRSTIDWSLRHELTEAQLIRVSASTLSVDPSRLIYLDADGNQVTLEVVNDTVLFNGVSVTVERLRLTRGAADPEWVTDRTITVSSWVVDPVRDSAGVLTDVRIRGILDAAVVVNAYTAPAQLFEATYHLLPSTSEL